MNGGGRRTRRATRRTGRELGAPRSPLIAFVIALSLLVQLFAVASPQALPAPAYAGADKAAVAAELKAFFGDAAELCAHVDDQGAPSKHGLPGHCCDQCPLCRFAAQTASFVPPDAPALPERLDADCRAVGSAPDFGALPAYFSQPNPARAPPLSV